VRQVLLGAGQRPAAHEVPQVLLGVPAGRADGCPNDCVHFNSRANGYAYTIAYINGYTNAMIARVSFFCLCLALSAAAREPAARVDDTVKAAFASGDADAQHRPAAFAPDELLSERELLEPFAKGKFGFPYVKVHEDGGDTTRKFDGSVEDVDAALDLVKSEKVSLVLQLEHLDEDEWPAAIVSLVPADLRGELVKKQGNNAGTTVHAYVSAPGVAALPTHSDIGDVFVIQLAGKKAWTIGENSPEKTLKAGDALWVPAGEEHSARASDDDVSCHLTIHRVTDDQVAARQSRRRAAGLVESWAAEGFVVIDSPGKDACEDRGFDEFNCEQVGCCEFKGGKCKSAVGSKNCLSASQESHCSPKISEDTCRRVGCCSWTRGECVPADEAKTSCDFENYYNEDEWVINQPDRCEDGDRGCDGCSCMECNLCTDAGAFCTRSVSDLTKKNPCCAAYNNGDMEFLDETDDQLSFLCSDDDGGEATADAEQFRTVASDDAPRGKGCNWIADDPDSRCELEGVYQETAWLTIDTTYIRRLYGKDQIYATQPKYKAKDACPIACGASETTPRPTPRPTASCKKDDKKWYSGKKKQNCKWAKKECKKSDKKCKKACKKKGKIGGKGKKIKATEACCKTCADYA